MRVIIAGCRKFSDYDMLCRICDGLPWKFSEVVSGGAPGADALGERYSKNILAKEPKVFPANWDEFGTRAGPMRNIEMGKYADALVAFWDGNRERSGTYDMILKMLELSKPVHVEIFEP